MHDESCFITLTYDEDNVPHLPDNTGYTLDKKNMVNFMKRLRDSIYPKKISFFQCGEYGENLGRPHHHAIIFGYAFPDKKLARKDERGYEIYQSEELKKLWPAGNHTIGNADIEAIAYVCRYVLKKQFGHNNSDHYGGAEPEYVTMSRRPAIGKLFYQKYGSDITNYDRVVRVDGVCTRPPRYYDKLLERQDVEKYKKTKTERRENAIEIDRMELKRRREYLKHQLKLYERKFENGSSTIQHF